MIRTLLLTCAMLTAVGPLGKSFSQQITRHDSHFQAILLHNGNVLTGRIVPVAGGFEVVTNGGLMQIEADEAVTVAESIIALYEHQRRHLGEPTAGAHLDLAAWCIRHQLWPQAAREIVDARGIDPQYPRLEMVERRLAVASHAARAPQAKAVESVPAAADPDKPPAPVVPKLSDAALEQFVRRIQPVLVNNCTTADCHREGGSPRFQLSRALLYDESNRQTTQQNLAATLRQVDPEQPEESPLVRMSVRSHGGLDAPPLAIHRRELHQQLVEWVNMVTGQQPPPPPEQPSEATGPVRRRQLGIGTVQRGAMGARRRLPNRSPHLKYGLHLEKVEEEDEPEQSTDPIEQ